MQLYAPLALPMSMSAWHRSLAHELSSCVTIHSKSYCHMPFSMVKLIVPMAYDTTRRNDDGGRSAPTAQRARMDSVQARAKRKRVFLCAQMEARTGLHRCWEQAGNSHKRGGLEEDQRGVIARQKPLEPLENGKLISGP